ncbi:hypothetical protein PHLCEN_2v124 [Hermanssonia centrifuga]|uniref:Uncharacterized protein n=1 Tax=Hermanssonia centrifuga TaxID=98765 RepID=A0A2R6S783_9APHY|nr:hypothetical protein PHLCEN_2v124 [Hermanssonia centrifuga]
MGQFYNELPDDEKLIEWIKEQKLFHVATAPLKGILPSQDDDVVLFNAMDLGGHVNVSPKGLPSFKLVNKRACWYLDLAGSSEISSWSSHLRAPHRFLDYSEKVSPGSGATPSNKFSSSILSIGKVFERGTPEFDEFFRPDKQAEDQYDFSTPELLPGARSVIWIDITQVGLSCGYTVPIMIFEKHQYATQFPHPAYISVVRTGDTHTKFAARLEERDSATDDPFSLPPDKGMMSYMVAMNTWSIDGLPGMMQNAERATKENIRKTMVNLAPVRRSGGYQSQYYVLVGTVCRYREITNKMV